MCTWCLFIQDMVFLKAIIQSREGDEAVLGEECRDET
jgi:hypothetical protein